MLIFLPVLELVKNLNKRLVSTKSVHFRSEKMGEERLIQSHPYSDKRQQRNCEAPTLWRCPILPSPLLCRQSCLQPPTRRCKISSPGSDIHCCNHLSFQFDKWVDLISTSATLPQCPPSSASESSQPRRKHFVLSEQVLAWS